MHSKIKIAIVVGVILVICLAFIIPSAISISDPCGDFTPCGNQKYKYVGVQPEGLAMAPARAVPRTQSAPQSSDTPVYLECTLPDKIVEDARWKENDGKYSYSKYNGDTVYIDSNGATCIPNASHKGLGTKETAIALVSVFSVIGGITLFIGGLLLARKSDN
jgi:hypothetical protein